MNIKTLMLSILVTTAIPTVAYAESASNFAYAAAEDPEILQAQKEAQSKINKFEKAFKSKSSQHSFMIKADFVENGQHEHMWLTLKKIKGNNFYGVLDNEPRFIKKIKIGDQVTVKKNKIEDWMILDNQSGDWQGGFTVKVLLKRQQQ